jgi:hypothetical protein
MKPLELDRSGHNLSDGMLSDVIEGSKICQPKLGGTWKRMRHVEDPIGLIPSWCDRSANDLSNGGVRWLH